MFFRNGWGFTRGGSNQGREKTLGNMLEDKNNVFAKCSFLLFYNYKNHCYILIFENKDF